MLISSLHNGLLAGPGKAQPHWETSPRALPRWGERLPAVLRTEMTRAGIPQQRRRSPCWQPYVHECARDTRSTSFYSPYVFTVCIVGSMSVSRVLLGILADGPAHGYDIKQAHDRRFPGAKPLAFGQVYAALAKLEKEDLVEVVKRGREAGPDRMTYAITDAGRDALAEWLCSTEPAGPYSADDLVRKTVTALRLGRDAAGFLAAQRQVHLAALKGLLELQASTDDVAARIVIDHTVEHLDADLRWLETAAARVSSSIHDRKMRA